GDAGTIGRALPDVVALVERADRHRGLGRVRGEIVQRVQAAEPAQRLDDVFRHLALVESVASLFRDGAQGPAQFRLLYNVPGDGGLAARQQITRRVDAGAQLLKPVVPVEGD